MDKMVQIRWHGRAGQGVVTASQLLAETMAREGMHVQAFPNFGAEKRGAPISAFTRISKEKIRVHNEVYKPDMVVVVDPTLIGLVDIAHGTDEHTLFLFNAPFEPAKIKEKLGLASNKVYAVDATTIALEEIGRAIPNVPMLAALLHVTGMLPTEKIKKSVEELLSARFKKEVVEANLRTIDRAIKEVRSL